MPIFIFKGEKAGKMNIGMVFPLDEAGKKQYAKRIKILLTKECCIC